MKHLLLLRGALVNKTKSLRLEAYFLVGETVSSTKGSKTSYR